jgi:hypothetical protein
VIAAFRFSIPRNRVRGEESLPNSKIRTATPSLLAGWDDLTREIEARRHEAAERLESERLAAQELQIAKRGAGAALPSNSAVPRNNPISARNE